MTVAGMLLIGWDVQRSNNDREIQPDGIPLFPHNRIEQDRNLARLVLFKPEKMDRRVDPFRFVRWIGQPVRLNDSVREQDIRRVRVAVRRNQLISQFHRFADVPDPRIQRIVVVPGLRFRIHPDLRNRLRQNVLGLRVVLGKRIRFRETDPKRSQQCCDHYCKYC